MRLIMGGINGHYLRDVVENAQVDTEEVIAAVAYAHDASLLFDWCWKNQIPLKFYGRLDESVAVSVPVLTSFLARWRSDYKCWLVRHHHAKVIWWRGVGVYVGSANLTDAAWYKNVEAGCFFSEEEITDDMANDILSMFEKLHEHATELNKEVLVEMQKRVRVVTDSKPSSNDFWESPSFRDWPGLVQTSPKKASDRKKEAFLREWHSTLQELRTIGTKISKQENRPRWITANTPANAQADQFLHAYYYKRTFDGKKANYPVFYERNKDRREDALNEAINWWQELPTSQMEAEMLNVTLPYLQEVLSEEHIQNMQYEDFFEVCMRVHAIKDYSRRVRNKSVNLPDNGTQYSIPQKVAALATRIWNDKSSSGHNV